MNIHEAHIELQAADGGGANTAKVRGVAYSGGDIMQLMGNMVVDLAGMEFAPQVPLMNSHCNDPDKKLGEVVPRVEGDKLLVEGAITSTSDEAARIIADGKLSRWQLSIGANILARHFVDKGEKATVNGIAFTGPICVVDRSMLREVSVVAIGADKGASMEITASLQMAELQTTNPIAKGESEMDGKEINAANAATQTGGGSPATGVMDADAISAAAAKASEDAIRAERKRVSEIAAICNGEFNEIEAKAREEGWDVDKVRAEVLAGIRASRPKTGVNVNTGEHAVGKSEIECALCMRLGVSEDALAKSYDDKTVEAAGKICDISLKDVVHECIKLSGGSASGRIGISDDDIKASFSTVALPGILSNVANKVMLKSYTAVQPVAYKLCSVGSLNDFKESNRYRLTDMGNLEQVAPDGEIKDGGLTEESAKNQLDTYGKKFCLTRKMIIDDDLDAFAKIPAMMGQRAAKLVDQLFFARLVANPTQTDGKTLFHADHKNYVSTGGSFTKENLQVAIQMFENQTDAGGNYIAVSPRKLLVPTALKFKAKELLHSALMVAAGSTDALKPAYNVLSDENLEIVSSPYLTNTADWYLFGDPAEIDTFEIGFLKGKRTPTIQQGDTDFNTLGMWFRIFFDIGVREQDFRGVLKSVGA